MIKTTSYRIRIWLFTLISIISFSSFVFGQEQSQYDRGTPPQHAAGVSSLGSYMSADLGTVNLSNGALNFKIPLATVGGRGGLSIPLTVNYSSKVWSASKDTETDTAGQEFQAAYADYNQGDSLLDFYQRVGPGWTIGAAPIIFNRIVRIGKLPPGGPFGGCYQYTVPKLTVMLPDKGEIEFRDDIYDGRPLPSDCGGWVSASRGNRWHAVDGSGTIYISDIDNAGAHQFPDLTGVVITADGTRYRFVGMRCVSITDRNGNRIDITYTSSPMKVEYKDQLGRITKIEYFVADPHNPGITLAALVTVPGYNGNRYIKLKRAVMSANYRSDITPPSQVCTGNYDPFSRGYWNWCGSSPTILFPHSYGLFMQRIDNQHVLNEIVLPDQRSLRFKYNLFGEVAEAQLPTGGKVWYDYDHEGGVPAGNSPLWEIGGGYHTEIGEVDRTLIQRKIFDGSTLQATWNYFYTTTDAFVAATAPNGEIVLNERHRFMPSGRYTDYSGSAGQHDGTHYILWSTGLEWRTERRNAAGTAVLSAVEMDWTQRALLAWSGYPQEQPANDNRINQERRYLETGMMSKVDTTYDQYNNPLEVKEYDFDQTLKRRTVTSYISAANGFNYQTDDAIHILRLPDTQTTYDGLGNPKAQTITEYDVYVNDTNHDVLTGYPSVSQHDSSYGTSKVPRGNPTRVAKWRNTTSSFIYSYPRYDIVGNVVATKDEGGNVSSVSFADDYGDGSNPGTPTQNPATPTYALPTLLTSPPPLAGAAAHTARSQYNYATGLLTGFRDRNNVVTQTIYNDPFNRPTLIKSALGITGIESHTKTFYGPVVTPYGITLTSNDVLTATDQSVTGDDTLRSWTVTDGFGRTREEWSRDPAGDVKTETIYDALGRVQKVSNPFRAGQTPAYTTTAYDMLGRVTTVTGVDGSVVTNSYNANTTTVTNQAGMQRSTLSDALGRLKEVREAPNSPGFNYLTTYEYDALDNLVQVVQGSQPPRIFAFNSLKQLTSASNPESGTINYQYDDSDNLIVKTDARGVSAHYAYDAFDRVIRRWYNSSSSTTSLIHNSPALPADVGASNEATYIYDQQSLPSGAPVFTRGKSNGRLVAVLSGTGSTIGDYMAYDDAGRNTLKIQRTGSTDYTMSKVLNLPGAPTQLFYPSGRVVNYSYDVAGRTSSVTGTLGDHLSRSYSTELNYSVWGGLTKEKFGTNSPVYHKRHHNIRGQLYDVRASSANDEWGGELGALVNYYSTLWAHGGSGPDNNGNVLMTQTIVNGFYVEDRFTYDPVNRLKTVGEFQNGSSNTGNQTFDYDRWGNRTILSASGTGINNTAFEKEDAKNRLYAPGDLALADSSRRIRYDAAGNQFKNTYIGYGFANYDAENRITAIQNDSAGWSNYTYDADGKRTRRNISNQETWHVYGFDGELFAEYPTNGATSSPQKEYAYRNGQLLVTTSGATCGTGFIGTKSWGAMNPSIGHNTGQQEGTDWAAYVSSHGAAHMVYGPYDTTFGKGRHQAQFQLQVDNNSGNDVVATLDVVTGLGANVLAQREIRRNEFSAANTWQWFNVDFDHPCFGYVEARLYWHDNTNIKFRETKIVSSGSGGAVVNWLIADHLGTPRMIIDQSGSLGYVKRHDYLPFGEEVGAGVGGRSGPLGYGGGDGVRQQFTSKERDNDTELDYFLARYYSSVQGRFTSPDEFSGGPDDVFSFADQAAANPTFYADLTNPQSLNKYQYGFNNPLRYIDPDGHNPEPPAPQDPVIPLPRRGVPFGVPITSTSTSTSKPPNDATIIEGTKAVLDTICDYTGITALAEWIRPRPTPQPAPPPATTPPTENQQPLPPPPPSEVRGGDKLKPDPTAQGPHTTFKTDPKTGKVTKYTTWRPNPRNPSGFDPHKRVDVKPGGRPHRGVPTPHAQGRRFPQGVRPARKNELPK